VILIIGILLLLTVGIVLGISVLNKDDNSEDPGKTNIPEEKPEDLGNNVNTVEIKDNKGLTDIVIDDITISGVTINLSDKEDGTILTELFFEIKSTTTNLDDLMVTAVLLNNSVEDSANQKAILLKTEKTEDNYNRTLLVDISKIYNNPTKIKFIIEKMN